MLQKEDIIKTGNIMKTIIHKGTKELSPIRWNYIFHGELKNPFENKNKHIRSKGPTPNTKRTVFAVLDVVLGSLVDSIIWLLDFFFNFLLGILKK